MRTASGVAIECGKAASELYVHETYRIAGIR